MTKRKLPRRIQDIEDGKYVVWSDNGPAPEFRAYFDDKRIPVVGTRQVRVWGLHDVDETGQTGDEALCVLAEKFWQVELIARDGSRHEVNASMVRVPLESTAWDH